MKRWLVIVMLATATGVLLSCKGEVLTVGNANDAGTPAPAQGSGGPAGAEVWKGYFENFQFASSSDHITLTLKPDGAEGTAFFGDPPALAPPTNPDVGYPDP